MWDLSHIHTNIYMCICMRERGLFKGIGSHNCGLASPKFSVQSSRIETWCLWCAEHIVEKELNQLRTVLQKTNRIIEIVIKIYIVGYWYFTKPLYIIFFLFSCRWDNCDTQEILNSKQSRHQYIIKYKKVLLNIIITLIWII